MKRAPAARKKIWLVSALLAAILLVGLLFVRFRKRRRVTSSIRQIDRPDIDAAPPGIFGLTEAEVAARQPDFDLEAEMQEEQRLFLRRAIRQNLFNTFNIDLFGITIVMLLLDNFWGAIGSLFVLVLNLVVNVFQEMFTKKRLDLILKDLRPQALVIREGQLRGIDPARIVHGDHLVIGSGDEVLVDGEIVGKGELTVERASSDPGARQTETRSGDKLHAGDFCVAGRAVYRALEDGYQRHRASPGSGLRLLLEEMTPLQRFMEAVLRVLFALVLVFSVLLVADALISDAQLVSQHYRDAFSIVFGIAPTSLFFVLIITYATGTFRIAEHGALVYKSRSIEELANIKTLCISKESLVSGVQVTLEPVEPPAGHERLSENVVRRLLGDVMNSVPVSTDFGYMLAAALPGERRSPLEIAPFIYQHGWYGANFDEPDLRGTFVMGVPEVLEDNLVKGIGEILGGVEQRLTHARRGLGRWLERFSRQRSAHQDVSGDKERTGSQEISITPPDPDPTADSKPSQVDDSTPDWRQRLRARLERLLTAMEDLQVAEAEPEKPREGLSLLCAYLPEPIPLYDRHGEPLLPQALIPLTRLHITDAVHPEARQAIQALVDVGLQVKILAADSPERAAAAARQLGLLADAPSMSSGSELKDLSGVDFSRKVGQTDVFGDLTPALKAAIVRSLRLGGERVLMVGSKVGDVPALRQANLRVAPKSSAQAALRLTDILLLEESLEALPNVLAIGQRLVNGVLNTFQLHLSQVIAQLLLILSLLFLWLDRFPYHPTQGGVVSAFTIAVPNIFLSVWASTGRVTGAIIRRRLARFIVPAAATGAALAWAVYTLFMNRTQDLEYAQLAVTCALLMAGWLRVLFVQPPTPFWVGGEPLRGDRRVIRLVIGSVLLFLGIMAVPLFRDLMRFAWLSSLDDYLLVTLAVAIWAFILRTLWRARLMDSILDAIPGLRSQQDP